MGRRAFVTGSTGFLGLNLVAALRAQGWDVVGLHVPGVDPTALSRLGAIPVEGDLNDQGSLARSIPSHADAVFHLAANTSAWSRNNEAQYRDNVDGTRRLVEAVRTAHVGRFIFTSSISAFGCHDGVRVDESTPSNALRCGMGYNRTKFLAEGIVKEAARQGLPAIILNPCNILGPGDTHNWTRQYILPVCRGTLPGIPPGRATWCHVQDVVAALCAAVDHGEIGENYLLGGTEASFLEFVNAIEDALGAPRSTRVMPRGIVRVACALSVLKSVFDGQEPALTPEKYRRAVGTIICDCSKARRVLGYQASPLERVVGDTVAWLRAENML
jgi:dihydroflavonol-4-reductase